MKLKSRLEKIAASAGLVTRSSAKGAPYIVVNRLAIEELEAWYFGDWEAVCAAYPKAPANIPAKASYRAPDRIKGGTWEAFEHILQAAGYFAGGLRKIEAARTIAEHMVPSRNTSPSFRALRDVLGEMAEKKRGGDNASSSRRAYADQLTLCVHDCSDASARLRPRLASVTTRAKQPSAHPINTA
jgi:hypothetical protein